jgi:hypothetical protein
MCSCSSSSPHSAQPPLDPPAAAGNGGDGERHALEDEEERGEETSEDDIRLSSSLSTSTFSQKRPITGGKETYYRCRRDLYELFRSEFSMYSIECVLYRYA